VLVDEIRGKVIEQKKRTKGIEIRTRRERIGMTYWPSTLWIIVIPMNAKDRNRNIEIRVLIVDRWEAEGCDNPLGNVISSDIPVSLCPSVTWIAKELNLDRLVTQGVLPEKGHNLV
jgi:hypothetical protein